MRLSTLTAAAALAALAAAPASAATVTDLGLAAVPDGNVGFLPDSSTGEALSTITNSTAGYFDEASGRADPYDGTSFDDTGRYIVLGSTKSSGTTKAVFETAGTVLRILWGTPDTGALSSGENIINFYTSTDGTGTSFDGVTGQEIVTAASSAPSSGAGSAYVSIDPGQAWGSFEMEHFEGSPAFEASIKAVPLPAAAWLMIGGLGAVGAYARRARKAAPTA